jgi:hypothetical protein
MSDDGGRSAHVVRHQFSDWRRRRPFTGGVLLVLSGLLTAYLPAAYSSFIVISTGSFTGPAVMFGVLLLLCGATVILFPDMSGLFGFLGMLIATLALLGALGGFLIGTLCGCLGGLLSFAWSAPDDEGGGDDGQSETNPAE